MVRNGVVGMSERMITPIKAMYNNWKTRVRVDCAYRDVFSVTADVH